jgi:RHS repeat-associated protein
VKKTAGGSVTLYWPGAGSLLDESNSSGSTMAKQVKFAGLLVWSESLSAGGRFLFQDHLGSTRVTGDASGGLDDDVDYFPFGSIAANYGASPSSNHYTFTGYESDQGESSTDYAIFRNMSTSMGRFNRPDPYDGSYDFTNPQSLNQYAYVLNAPGTFIDPLGLDHYEYENDGNCLIRYLVHVTYYHDGLGMDVALEYSGAYCRGGGGGGGGVSSGGDTIGGSRAGGGGGNAANNCPGCSSPNQTVRQCANQAASSWSLASAIPDSVNKVPVLGAFFNGALGNTVVGITSIYDSVVNGQSTMGNTYGTLLGAGPTLGVSVPASAPAGLKGPVGILMETVASGAGRSIGTAKVVLDVLIYAEIYNFCKTGKY